MRNQKTAVVKLCSLQSLTRLRKFIVCDFPSSSRF